MKIELVLTLAENVRRLMKPRGDSQQTVADRAGVSQRAVGDLLTYGEGHFKNPTLKTLAGLGRAFDLPPWLLLIPGVPVEMIGDPGLPLLIRDYSSLPAAARQNILRVAEGEVRYAVAEGQGKRHATGG